MKTGITGYKGRMGQMLVQEIEAQDGLSYFGGTEEGDDPAALFEEADCVIDFTVPDAFVGRAPGKYAMFVGGSHRGDRLAGLHTKTVTFDDIPATVRALLADFSKNREAGETFTDFWGRSREIGPEPTPEQFHIEFAERAGHGPLTEI